MTKAVKEFAILFVTYSSVLVGAMWWSGKVTEPTIYDRYRVRLEGVGIHVSELTRSVVLYRDILSFEPLPGHKAQRAGFSLPDKRKLFVRAGGPEGAGSEIVLRVRNGFARLHEHLRGRIATLGEGENIPTITPMLEVPWGEEFTVTDYDGNRFVYFLPRRRSATRMEAEG